jgi:hypothetical protein
MPSYIPTKEADFLDWSANLIAVSKAHKTEWHLLEQPLADIETLHNEVYVFPIYDRKPTPHPAPSIQPETDAAPSGSRKHAFRLAERTVAAINPETGVCATRKLMPPLVKGVAFAHKLRLPGEPRAEAWRLRVGKRQHAWAAEEE